MSSVPATRAKFRFRKRQLTITHLIPHLCTTVGDTARTNAIAASILVACESTIDLEAYIQESS
jgi:hypothetical protein